ncbi:helix-turn-helix domain-containing protein [Streptomyces gilvus]|uniref:helix-turn-helix domain-containing protein n=1 Tax=Streptomyces gilvus TaxID=2920937 RepID=UPI001F0E4136|nr:helix-turn-helix transcriptional regulator [Streptomyces sp. CME 23]MCH5672461.1 helix-turn-helix domain-containing protein [Streptomyces sp. CME 23]
MSGATEAERTEEFARLLRELKDRSGLSYGVLAKRLHMSTSTLHRYCNGTAVPVEYAPVERLARVCRATPQELVELHRRWILADAARGRRTEAADAGTAAEAGTGAQAAAAGSDQGPVTGSHPGVGSDSTADADPHGQDDADDEPVVVDVPGGSAPPRRLGQGRRTALIASVAAAAVVGAVVFAVQPFNGDDTAARRPAGVTERADDTADAWKPSPTPSPSGASASASVSPSVSASSGSGKPKSGGAQGAEKPAADATGSAVPLTVGTRPYVYDSPCSQHFLVDSEPAQVGPPASEQDAPRWAAAYGAVSSGEQEIALTVQGTGAETVVLEAMHVRVLSKGTPLAWNDYSMGVGCGGGVETKSFDIALDSGSPTVTVKGGQRDFPYKVSESDPEVFYVVAHTTAYDVRWDLTLDWSSGSRRGTVHIDNSGTPFRTSADANRPGYDYPLGGSEWIKREDG